MPKHTLYAYVDGYDLQDIAAPIEEVLEEFVASRQWNAGKVWVVNQRFNQEECTLAEDFPPWQLGLNLELPDVGSESLNWFADVEDIANFLGKLHNQYDRDFVIGIADNERDLAEDLFDISTPEPDLVRLKQIIGV